MLEVEELRQRRIAFVKEIENEVEKVLTLAEQREQTGNHELCLCHPFSSDARLVYVSCL
eukprot:SAG31_NODE_349_length_17243_cov_7.408248_7_plen_59_part_00